VTNRYIEEESRNFDTFDEFQKSSGAGSECGCCLYLVQSEFERFKTSSTQSFANQHSNQEHEQQQQP
jgi:bacterioferritin-associated ferredoxin